MRFRRRNQGPLISLLVVGFGVTLLFFVFIWSLFSSTEHQAKLLVDEFYSYEQKGDFSSSWSLFHSSMKEKFHKGDYIQDRAHVFMNHFGVETFTYELSEPEKLEGWKMSKIANAFDIVYKITVIQTYKGKYGNFDIHQDVFVVKENEEWRMMWDYNQ